MTAWLTSLRDRPIAESERTRAMATVTVLLVAATILLALSRATGQAQHGGRPRQASPANSAPRTTPGTSVSRAGASGSASAPYGSTLDDRMPSAPGLARAADLFLAGYLRYLYGHGPASQVLDATPALLRSLLTHLPRVSPGMLATRPRVVALHSVPASSAPTSSGLFSVSAVVNDGGVVNYAIDLLLTQRNGRLLVSGIEGGAR
jgi:hypothetical protein